ncbi:hypothetical protein ACQKII_23665 [Lysinibacillus sp. NPDC048646]|uniref:hypothetical protein n=1 Tax=Lysinibacillus sp. NPDC048646 TaxID=3390574 RepID=UPI003CFEDBFF
MRREEVSLDKIHINLLNPRHLPQENEEKEFEQMIENGQLENLLKDIAQFGLDPSENLLLTYDEVLQAYITEEGNRRITALKLLKDPDSLPIFIKNREKYIAMIKNTIRETKYKNIETIPAVIMDNVPLMNHFIELKHTKNHSGAGRLDWDTESQIRFQKKKDPFKFNLLNLLMKIIPGKTSNFNITTVERIIGDPDMRKALFLEIHRPTGLIKFTNKAGYDGFVFIVKGLSNKTLTVGNFHSKEDRIRFINDFLIINSENNTEGDIDIETPLVFDNLTFDDIAATLDNPALPIISEGNDTIEDEVGTKLETINDLTTENVIADDSQIKPTRNTRQPEPKKRPYFFHGVNYKGDLYGIKHSLFEIHRIEAKKFTLSTTMLFRTLFECVIQQYVIVNNLEIKSKSPIDSLSIASLLKTCTENSNGNFKSLEKHNSTIARILNEAYAQKDYDELNIVTHGNQRGPSYIKLDDIERRWYEAIKIMVEQISGH